MHAVDGWNVGPSLNHYRNFKVWITKKSYEQYTETLSWFPYHIRMSHTSTDEYAIAAAQYLVTSLSNPVPLCPFAPLKDSYYQALEEIFKQATDPDPQSPTIPIPFN